MVQVVGIFPDDVLCLMGFDELVIQLENVLITKKVLVGKHQYFFVYFLQKDIFFKWKKPWV